MLHVTAVLHVRNEDEHAHTDTYAEVIYTDIYTYIYIHTHTHIHIHTHTGEYSFNILVRYLLFYTYCSYFQTKLYILYLTYMYPILEYSSTYLILEYYVI
jgi:hypothetical protein